MVVAGLMVCLAGCGSRTTSSSSESSLSSILVKPPIAAVRAYKVESPNGARDDEYYWLRHDTRKDKTVLDYLAADNAYADVMLAHTKTLQNNIYTEIVGRIKQDDSSVPHRKGGYWYYRRFETGKEYPIHARKKATLNAPEQILLDVNQMAAGHDYFYVGSYRISPDNKLIAWTEDSVGRNQFNLRVKNLETGAMLPDSIANIDYDLVWAGDSKTILYVAKDPMTLLGDKVFKHVLGIDAKKDVLIYEEKDKSFYIDVGATKDGEFVTIVSDSTVSIEVRVARANDPMLGFRVLIPRERDHEYRVEHLGNRWIIRTNWQAMNFRIVEAGDSTIANRKSWRDVVVHRGTGFVPVFGCVRILIRR